MQAQLYFKSAQIDKVFTSFAFLHAGSIKEEEIRRGKRGGEYSLHHHTLYQEWIEHFEQAMEGFTKYSGYTTEQFYDALQKVMMLYMSLTIALSNSKIN